MWMAQHGIVTALQQFYLYPIFVSDFGRFTWNVDTYFWAQPLARKALINISRGCYHTKENDKSI